METNQRNIINDSSPEHFAIKRRKPKTNDSLSENASVEEDKPAKKRGRPIVAWRHTVEGKVDNRPNDPGYAKKYWLATYKKPFTCDNCGKTLTCSGSAIPRHKETMHCRLAKFTKQDSN